MTTTEILSILFLHWVADFVCQTDKMAQGKSKNWNDLLTHTGAYSLIWLFPICILFGFSCPNQSTEFYVVYSLLFSAITFICHTVTDYFTSRLNSKLWKEQKVHWFFVSIGFDQWLHYLQLFLTYEYLKTL